MKAITLTQPWASLVAIGAKRIETRSWKTNYRGPLAIHAAKGWDPAIRAEARRNHRIAATMSKAGLTNWDFLPRGCIVATCELHMIVATNREGWEWLDGDGCRQTYKLDQQELCFGDYTPGRWAWLLANTQELDQPVPARGGLGLWEWEAK